MKGKVAVVTGASEGIGRELALNLARRGADVVVAARNEAALSATARDCEASGARALAVPTDVSTSGACERLVERTVEAFGGIDFLVNNAGISTNARVDAVQDLTVFDRVMRINYLGAVYCTALALPHLKARRGLVVGISSLQGKTGFPTYAAYAASKHALQGFFDSLRIELWGSGVDVLVVSPGPVATEIHDHRLGADGRPQAAGPRMDRTDIMSAAACAERIVRAMERREREVVMTWQGKLGLVLKLFAPRVLDRMVDAGLRRFTQASNPGNQEDQAHADGVFIE
jgi:short-subunit dehydrogenase